MDVIALSQALIRYPSITPQSAGCLDFIGDFLQEVGFSCHRLNHPPVDNLYARWGTTAPNFCFAGHVDVVPPGEYGKWQFEPFSAVLDKDYIYGRGIVDMKGAIAAFMIAAKDFIQNTPFTGSLSFLLTSDEEGPALYGTKHVLQHLKKINERLDACLVGEPTSTLRVGDTIKVGRRGSVNFSLTENGTGGHVAYPDLADNPIPRFLDCLSQLIALPLDQKDLEGPSNFQPSIFQIVSVDVGNTIYNMIPERISALLNCRFNPHHTGDSLCRWLHNHAGKFLKNYELTPHISGEAFYCNNDHIKHVVQGAILKSTGLKTTLSTGGGTSDARFIKDMCPVIELGLLNKTAHHANERSSTADLKTLEKIYGQILVDFFKK